MSFGEWRFAPADRVRIVNPALSWESDRATVVGWHDGSGWCASPSPRTGRVYRIRIDNHDYGTAQWDNCHTVDEAMLRPLNTGPRDDVDVQTEVFWQVQVPRRSRGGGWAAQSFYIGAAVVTKFDTREGAVEAAERDLAGGRPLTLFRYVKVTRVTAERVEVDE